MKKKILASLLSAAMLMGLLAGCGGTAASAGSGTQPENSETSAAAPVTEEQPGGTCTGDPDLCGGGICF